MFHEDYVKNVKHILELMNKYEPYPNDKSKILSQINRLVQTEIHKVHDEIESAIKELEG
jgi:hypothetical protein